MQIQAVLDMIPLCRAWDHHVLLNDQKLNCHQRTNDVSQDFQEPFKGNAVLGAGGMQRA